MIEVNDGAGARRARERRLVHHHHVAHGLRAREPTARARFLVGERASQLEQIAVKHFVNERAFAGAGDAGDAGENAERELDVDAAQIVL